MRVHALAAWLVLLPACSFTTLGPDARNLSPDPNALDTNTPNRLEIGTDIATGKGVNITTAGGAVTLNAPLIQNLTTSTIKTAGGYQYRSNVPHLSRRLDAVQSYWCWPEEYAAEAKAKKGR